MLKQTNRSFRISKTAKTTDRVAVYGKNPSDQRMVSLYRLSQTMAIADPSGVMPSVFKGEFTTLEEARAAMTDIGDYAIVYDTVHKTGIIEMKARNGSFTVVEIFNDETYFPMNKVGYIVTADFNPTQRRAVCATRHIDPEYPDEPYYTFGLGPIENAEPIVIWSAHNTPGTLRKGTVFVVGLTGGMVFYERELTLLESEGVYSLATTDETPLSVNYISATNEFSLYDGTQLNFFFHTEKTVERS